MFALAISGRAARGGSATYASWSCPRKTRLYAQLERPRRSRGVRAHLLGAPRPDPTTPANELQSAVARARTNADALFTRPGLKGADTDCGQLFVLLGEPPEVVGREAKVHSDAAEAPARRPAARDLIYRSRPGDAVTFTGGELRVS